MTEMNWKRVITLSSIKGGVGKTTDAILLANNLAARGFKVLYFDLDGNNSGTMYYTTGIEHIEELIETHNTFEALSNNNFKKFALPTRVPNIDIIPSHLKIFKLRGIGYNELQKTLRDYKEVYDYVVIDTPPTYDNLVINALTASDIILTPLKFTSFDFSTAKFLQSQLYDDCPNKVDNWYLLYSDWQKSHANFETSTQTQYAHLFEQEFSNILDVHIPRSSAAYKYTQTGEAVSTKSSMEGKKTLALEINKLANMITGETSEEKYAERF